MMATAIILSLILFGGVFVSSGRFMNVENDAKVYFVVISVVLLLLICSFLHKGLSKLSVASSSHVTNIGFTVVCLMHSAYAFVQYIGLIPSGHSAFPITGTYENPAGFAAVQATLFPFAISLSFEKESKYGIRWFSAITSVVCVVMVVLSGSRAGFLAICASLSVVIALRTNLLSVLKRNYWLWLPLIVFVVISSVLLYHIKITSANGRLFVWSICWDMIKECPLLGYGIGGFEKHYMDAQAAYFSLHPDSSYGLLADNIKHPFNEYIKLIINYGIVGLAVSFFLFTAIIKRILKSEENVKVIRFGVISSIFVMCQFSYPFHYAVIWYIAAITIVPVFFKETTDDKGWGTPKKMQILLSVFLIFLFAMLLRMMYLELKWSEMSRRSLVGQTERMLPHYDIMKPQMRHNPLFLYNYAAEMNYVGRYEESLVLAEECVTMMNDYDVQMLLADNHFNLCNYDEALKRYETAHYMCPNRFAPMYKKFSTYKKMKDYDNMVEIGNAILDKKIKIPSREVDMMINDVRNELNNIKTITTAE